MAEGAGNISILKCPNCASTIKVPVYVLPCEVCGYDEGSPP